MAYTWKKQASSAYGLSLTQLVLNAVMFAEELPEQYEDWMDYQKQTDRRVILLIKEFLDGQDILDEVKALRRQAEKEMNTVISYTDAFLVYEYALNRLERRFCPDMPDVTVKEQELVSQLTAYIFGGEDSNAVQYADSGGGITASCAFHTAEILQHGQGFPSGLRRRVQGYPGSYDVYAFHWQYDGKGL